MRYAGLVIACYISSYIFLSLFGRFEPSRIGASVDGDGVRDWMWSPKGFHDGFRQRWGLYYFYLPLFEIDRFYWHDEVEAWGGKYPTSKPSTATEWAEWDSSKR